MLGAVPASLRVLVLGAGFGGLELSTMLSEALGDEVEVTLIDKSDAFVFGYSKLDVMFGRTTLDAVRLPYRDVVKPGVRFVQETITAIDPEARRVTTDAGVHEADVLVVALGADYDLDATPGLAEAGNEFYSVAGAERLARGAARRSRRAARSIGVCGAPFKCPPAPSECALLLHDYLTARGVRDDCEITFVIPFGDAGPALAGHVGGAASRRSPSATSTFVPGRRVASLDAARKVAVLDDGARAALRPVPRRPEAPRARRRGRERHDRATATCRSTRARSRRSYPGVYAVGDVATVGAPKAGVFAEGAARVVAEHR